MSADYRCVRMSLLGSKRNKCLEQKCENQSLNVGLFDLKIWRNAVFKTILCVIVCVSLSKGIPLKGNLTGLTDLTHPQLKKHMEAAINIGVTELKARFCGLLNDEAEVKTPV